ncbi:putative iron-regulated membrane protein [Polymorphobacter multimanifer]|uniref:Putative iron-regulated membrane protein n=1 Tax=Polymorphobacter multimanifer TaxID=1070431 RepID=A0A841L9C4_9SPHN|nr:PepSY-associated TM helix domain-containing protein [Polymorphobacter multimanifer]MBB6229144.1 putative iron-regulated membrane protein [Polymorphobacter multimanifer]
MHRWIGLVMAGFLIVAGATGALLVWHHELSAALAPELYRIDAPQAGATPVDPAMLRDMAAAQTPGAAIAYLPLNSRPGEALFLYAEGAAKPELAVDLYTGRVLSRWDGGSLLDGRVAIMPFLYQLHYSLALGTVGTWTFGIVALLWTIDTFVGAYLTFPARRVSSVPARMPASWLARWRPSWSVRRGWSAYKLNVDLHRAGGLWLWAMLFVFAWSSVGFNLSQVHTPVMRTIFAFREAAEIPVLPAPKPVPGLSWRSALDRGRSLMVAELQARSLTQRSETGLYHDAATGTFHYSVSSSADRADKQYGATSVVFDADTGARRDFSSPLDNKAGDTVTRWMYDLHMAAIWGRPYDVFVTLMGLGVVILSVTGIVIWAKKRGARVSAKRKRHSKNAGQEVPPIGGAVAAE